MEEQQYPKDINLQILADFISSIRKYNSIETVKEIRSTFVKTVPGNAVLERFTRIIYSLPYVLNLTINSGTRRPDNLRESGIEKSMKESDYIYDIFELLDAMHSEKISEPMRYVLVKRYIKANFDNIGTFYELISKRWFPRIGLEMAMQYVDGIRTVPIRESRKLTREILENMDFRGYYMIPNPHKEKGYSRRMFMYFNCYGEVSFVGENNKRCNNMWPIVNSVAFSFKKNRIRNMVIEGTVFIPDADMNEDTSLPYHYSFSHPRMTIPPKATFMMYDMYRADEFFSGKTFMTYDQRYAMLCEKMAEAVKPKNFIVAERHKIESTDWLVSHLRTDYPCDGYIIMSPNRMDSSMLQEYTVTKNRATVSITDAAVVDGKLVAKIAKKKYDTLLTGCHESVKRYLTENFTELINKDVDIVHLGKSEKGYEMPMLCQEQKDEGDA